MPRLDPFLVWISTVNLYLGAVLFVAIQLAVFFPNAAYAAMTVWEREAEFLLNPAILLFAWGLLLCAGLVGYDRLARHKLTTP